MVILSVGLHLAEAVLDRLLHQAQRILLKGGSLRRREPGEEPTTPSLTRKVAKTP